MKLTSQQKVKHIFINKCALYNTYQIHSYIHVIRSLQNKYHTVSYILAWLSAVVSFGFIFVGFDRAEQNSKPKDELQLH